MLSKEEFVRRILDGAPPTPEADADAGFDDAMLEGFDGFDGSGGPSAAGVDTRFAQLLLEESGFGRGETLPRGEVVLGDQKTKRFLPHGATYWAKTTERPFHILLFDLELKGSEILDDDFFLPNDQLEDALHRIVQDALEGFERGGAGRTADRKKGAQAETLCVVSVIDDQRDGPERQIVCFGTKCTATDALEVFTLREEARCWDRPLAEEHLGQLFERHFKRLGTGARWQDAFVSGEERKKARLLMDECARLIPDEKQLQTAIRGLLDEIAGSFGLRRRGGRGGHRLVMHALPEDHSIAVDPEDARQKGFKNPFQGLRIFDADERLIGYIVYVLDKKSEAERLHRKLAQHNHFHNVLVVYPENAGATLELWQGTEPLRGRLISGTRRSRFDGEGGVVQLLSRFFVVSRSAIGTPRHLATELAWRAQHLKALAIDELNKEKNKPKDQRPLRDLLDVFNQALATLDETQFADAYAQTITYGLLAARWLSSGRQDVRFARRNIDALLPSTSPFLHNLFRRLVNSRFDQNLSWLLDDITSLLSRTMVAEVFQGEQDPSIHFYQDFLDEYDPQIRKDQGVYYTPDEVVSYIVRTAHTALKERFGLELGLADTTSWTDFAKATDIEVPEDIDGDEPFVQILDPALGTGTFLLRVIEVIHETMMAQYAERGLAEKASRREWVKYVRAHLLPRLNGFELMMAPYIVSHLRLGLALQQTGFVFSDADRLRVFLTNTLAPMSYSAAQAGLFEQLISAEGQDAAGVRSTALSVLIGNPPYSKNSMNRGAYAEGLVQPFKEAVKGERNVQPLSDDYIKFLAFGIGSLGTRPGLLGMITNRSYLDGLIHRGMRRILMDSFEQISVVDLHGDSNIGEKAPGGEANENVFNITQGVATLSLVRTAAGEKGGVELSDVWGTREEKLAALGSLRFEELKPDEPMLFWVPFDTSGTSEYESFTALDEACTVVGMGLKSRRDGFLVAMERDTLVSRFHRLTEAADAESLRTSFGVKDNPLWSLGGMQQLVRSVGVEEGIKRIEYRPFDRRFIWYHPKAIERGDSRWPVMKHVLPDNLSLLVARQTKAESPDAVFVVRGLSEMKTAEYSRGSYTIPLWLNEQSAQLVATRWPRLTRRPNLKQSLLEAWAKQIATAELQNRDVEDLFHYVYAILNSRSYRERYSSQLRTGFPRVPLGLPASTTSKLVGYGRCLVGLHLLDEDYPGRVELVDSVLHSNQIGGCVRHRVNAPKSAVFKFDGNRIVLSPSLAVGPVSLRAWNYSVGGYQVLAKWLQARKKSGLQDESVAHLCRVVDAIETTLAVVDDLDSFVAAAGGWASLVSGAGNA